MIQASAPDTTRFQASTWWAVAVSLLPTTIVGTCMWTTLNLLFGTSYGPDSRLLVILSFPVLNMVAVTQVVRRRLWVSVSAAGLEIAQRGVPILVEWDNVASASVRRRGLFAVLEVTPVDLRRVRRLGPGADLPQVQRLAGGLGFRIEVGTLWPIPGVLRAALTRHAPGG
jgi:hypothetical protein